MSVKKRFSVIGGDRRQAELARLLREDGNEVSAWGLCQEDREETELTKATAAEVLILPLPLCKKEGFLNCREQGVETRQLFRELRPGQLVLAGQVREAQAREADEAKITLVDYLAREELAVANAVPSAEGAIQIAMERLPITLGGAEVLVLGYGRIGKLLAHRLHGLGARVTVAARKYEDRTWAKAFGCEVLRPDRLDGQLGRFCVVFNTAPALLLGESLLRQLPKDCLCIDVASQPGLDFDAAAVLGLQTIWARGLPGKLSPVSAAAAIRDTVYHILEERGDHT